MKRVLTIFLLIFIFLLFISDAKSENEKIILKLQKGNKTAYINDQPFQIDVAPIVIPPGRIMVPVRFVAEGLGANVKWINETETIIITIDSIPYLKYQMINLKNELSNKDLEINQLKNQIKEKDEKINSLEKENEELKNRLKEYKENIFMVKKVIDGDTIELENGFIVRYLWINAPESGQNFYEEAKQRNKELVEGKKVKLEYDVQIYDNYQRILAYVFVDDIFVNLQLVKEGLALVETISPNIKYIDDLLNAQKYAKENGLGIWKKSEIKLKIIFINYDAPGNDHENLNGEWVEIKNLGNEDVNLKDFKLKDTANHEFIFPDFVLSPNSIVKIYSGCGTNTDDSLYWCSTNALWNNDTDTAFLYDSQGNLIDSYKYP